MKNVLSIWMFSLPRWSFRTCKGLLLLRNKCEFSLAFFYWYVAGKFDIKCDWDPTEILGFPFSANQLLTMLHLLRDAIVKVSMAVANAMIWSSQTAPLPALPCNFIDFLMFFFDICFIIFGQTFWFSNRDLKFFFKNIFRHVEQNSICFFCIFLYFVISCYSKKFSNWLRKSKDSYNP